MAVKAYPAQHCVPPSEGSVKYASGFIAVEPPEHPVAHTEVGAWKSGCPTPVPRGHTFTSVLGENDEFHASAMSSGEAQAAIMKSRTVARSWSTFPVCFCSVGELLGFAVGLGVGDSEGTVGDDVAGEEVVGEDVVGEDDDGASVPACASPTPSHSPTELATANNQASQADNVREEHLLRNALFPALTLSPLAPLRTLACCSIPPPPTQHTPPTFQATQQPATPPTLERSSRPRLCAMALCPLCALCPPSQGGEVPCKGAGAVKPLGKERNRMNKLAKGSVQVEGAPPSAWGNSLTVTFCGPEAR